MAGHWLLMVCGDGAWTIELIDDLILLRLSLQQEFFTGPFESLPDELKDEERASWDERRDALLRDGERFEDGEDHTLTILFCAGAEQRRKALERLRQVNEEYGADAAAIEKAKAAIAALERAAQEAK